MSRWLTCCGAIRHTRQKSDAAQYVDADKGVADTKAARWTAPRYILMERFAEDAALLAKVRDYLVEERASGLNRGER
ncbi:hypothetical protein MJ391_26255 [Escherichia coli]|nr:hypothetical protein MJ391_26255 [Escherichia coli]